MKARPGGFLYNAPMGWTSLCDLDELEEGKGKYVEIGGFQLAVFLDKGAVRVIDNNCPHAGGNLALTVLHHANNGVY